MSAMPAAPPQPTEPSSPQTRPRTVRPPMWSVATSASVDWAAIRRCRGVARTRVA